MSKLNYAVWHTKDGRKVAVSDMDNLHLLHTIRAITEGRIFPKPLIPYANGDEREGMEGGEVLKQISDDDKRENWLTVLKAEAIHRGLDWSTPPSRRINLIAWLYEQMEAKYYTSEEIKRGIQKRKKFVKKVTR